jgi:hypothetical protein
MSSNNKLTALNKFRSVNANAFRPASIKVLVVYDVQVKTPEVSQVPLVVNYGEIHSFGFGAYLAHRSHLRSSKSRRGIRSSVGSSVFICD